MRAKIIKSYLTIFFVCLLGGPVFWVVNDKNLLLVMAWWFPTILIGIIPIIVYTVWTDEDIK